MRTYRTLLVSAALAPLAMGATMIANGDWQAALAAVAGLTAGAFLIGLTRLLAIAERPASPARSAPRRRALAGPTPAAEPRREPAPSAVAPPRPRAAEAGRGTLTAIGPDPGLLSRSQATVRRTFKPRMQAPRLR
jgi:hypothetical protein